MKSMRRHDIVSVHVGPIGQFSSIKYSLISTTECEHLIVVMIGIQTI